MTWDKLPTAPSILVACRTHFFPIASRFILIAMTWAENRKQLFMNSNIDANSYNIVLVQYTYKLLKVLT